MAVPEQVRKQAEQVKQFYENQPGEGEGNGNQQPDHLDGAEARTPETPDPNAHEGGGDNGGTPEDYEQRWRSLQGSYNAAMRRGSELEQRNIQLQTLIATMQSAPTPPQGQQEQPDYRLVSEEEAADYGDSIDVMRKVSREELTPLVQRLMQIERVLGNVTERVVPQVQNLAVRQHQSAEQQFWGVLAQLVPDWRDINEDPAFQGWLLEIDPLTGSSRQAFLEQAQQNLDAHRVAHFFAQWRGGGSLQPAPQQGGNGQSPSELELQIAPGRSRGGPPVNRNQRTYTTADISRFYDDVRKGVFKGRDEEKGRIERDIFAAQGEGRIVG